MSWGSPRGQILVNLYSWLRGEVPTLPCLGSRPVKYFSCRGSCYTARSFSSESVSLEHFATNFNIHSIRCIKCYGIPLDGTVLHTTASICGRCITNTLFLHAANPIPALGGYWLCGTTPGSAAMRREAPVSRMSAH